MNYNWNWGIFWEMSPDGQGTYFITLIVGPGLDARDGACAWVIALVLGSVARRDAHHAVQVGGAPRQRVRRAVPQHPAAGPDVPVVLRACPSCCRAGSARDQADAAAVGVVRPRGDVPRLFTAARVAEQVRAGIQSLPRGQGMAGTALGLTLPQTYRYVLLPMAFRIILPPLTSET